MFSCLLQHWLATKIMSQHPLPFLKPLWDTGMFCNHLQSLLDDRTKIFPTMSSKLMPRQLSQLWRSPCFGMGTTSAFLQSATTSPFLHTTCINCKSLFQRAAPPHNTSLEKTSFVPFQLGQCCLQLLFWQTIYIYIRILKISI